MLSAPKHFAAAFAIAVFLSGVVCSPSRSQASANLLSPDLSTSPRDSDMAAAVDQELLGLGRNGEVIQRVRTEVVEMLSEESSCSAWFRAAEPEAVAKFRSLRFTVDSSGSSEILMIQDLADSRAALQPYVARTGQNVGSGSTITLNANGAFFQEMARVRSLRPPSELGFNNAFRSLVVGNFLGATPAARILTVLHELGHVLDMLPIDAGFPAASLVSTRNTEAVLKYCGGQIRAHAKHLQKSENAKSLMSRSTSPAAAFTSPQPATARMANASRGWDWPTAEPLPVSSTFSNWLDVAPQHLAAARRMRSDMFLPEPLP